MSQSFLSKDLVPAPSPARQLDSTFLVDFTNLQTFPIFAFFMCFSDIKYIQVILYAKNLSYLKRLFAFFQNNKTNISMKRMRAPLLTMTIICMLIGPLSTTTALNDDHSKNDNRIDLQRDDNPDAEIESDDDDDGLDLSEFDFVGIDGDSNDVNFDDAEMFDMMNDISDGMAPNEGFDGAPNNEHLLNDENDTQERTLGVKLPVNINDEGDHSDDLAPNDDFENEE
uniref:Uncharacterized protein n=1 Tax=Clytia hemisphaerica TaxID=252671 RepID=A0A7M5XCI9_9CNID|eukprot:TCONS_00031112-protein